MSDEEIWFLAKNLISDIALEKIPPREGMQKLVDKVYFVYNLHEKEKNVVGDSHDLQELIGNFYSYDELEEKPNEVSCNGKYGIEAVKEMDSIIVDLSKEWLKRHP